MKGSYLRKNVTLSNRISNSIVLLNAIQLNLIELSVEMKSIE